MKCFGCVLRCRMRCVGKHFVYFSLGFISFEVFCPVWALYNIKGGRDTPPRAPSSPPVLPTTKLASVALPRQALYRVPVCQTGTHWLRKYCFYMLHSLSRKTIIFLHGISISVPLRHPPTSGYISDCCASCPRGDAVNVHATKMRCHC